MRSFHVIVSTTLLAVGIAACSGSTSPAAQPAAPDGESSASVAAQVIEVRSGDYFFEPNALTVQPGSIRVIHTNQGPKRHSFNVRALDDRSDLVKTEQISRGDSLTIDFALAQEGTYRIYCAVADHAQLGEVGTLTVTRAS